MSKIKINELSAEQQARFPEFVKRWTDIGLSTAPADRPRAEAAIVKMYAAANLKTPLIVWCGSPLSQGLTRAILTDKKFMDNVGDSVWASVWDSVWDSVRDSVWANVRASVWASVRDSVRASVWANVGANVGANVRASVWASVRANVGASVGNSVGNSVWDSVWDSVRANVGANVGDSVGDSVRDSVGANVGASVGNSVGDSVWDSVWDSVYVQHDAGWLSFYSFFKEVGGLTDEIAPLSGLMELAESAGWALPHEKICFVSERHNVLFRDDRGLLHCENGPALSYPDGFEIYAWHGVRFPSEWLNGKMPTAAEALAWPNMEQRRVACEMIGWEAILRELDAKTVDRNDNPEIGELVRVVIPDIGTEQFLRVRCGTGRSFALPVPPNMKTAAQANAWTYGFDNPEDYQLEIRT